MADYYPLLTRAVRNLPDNSPEARQAIFLRARDALERQLRSVTPRLTDADIVRELLSLEDVIKRIDREMDEETAASAAALRQTEEAVAKLAPRDEDVDHAVEKDATAPSLPNAAVTPALATEAGSKPEAKTASAEPASRPTLQPATLKPLPRVKMPDGHGITPSIRKPSEQEALSEAPAVQPAQRIKLPDGSAGLKRKKKLGLFAVAGVIAIMAMSALAFFNRERPDRYQQTAETQRRDQAAAQDAAKREGRLTGDAGPQAPATPQNQPEVAPQRQVTSVPIQAPVTPAPQAPNAPTSPQPQAEQPALPVVSRAYMILELPGRPPNQYEGQANWSFAADPASRSPQKALRTSIEFADAGLSLEVSMAPATDSSLNASHIVTVAFTPRAGVDGVREMSAVEWREREGQVGTTLAGTLVPIQDNFFMIGLDATEAGKTRNLELLRTQRWMVFEIRMTNGRRGAFLIEKGSSGDKAIAEALSVWR